MTNQKDKAAKNLQDARKESIERTAEAVEANSGLKAPTGAQLATAQAEGITEAVKESAKDTYQALTDGQQLGDPPAKQWTGKDEVMQYAGLLDLAQDAFDDKIAKGGPVPEEKVAGLLELERAGRNRTTYVASMCKRLGVKSPYEVTNAGPPHTNDTTAITPIA